MLKNFFTKNKKDKINNVNDINEELERQSKENAKKLSENTQEFYGQIQEDLDYVLTAKPIGEDEYEELDQTFSNLLDEGEYKKYLKVKKEFFQDREGTIKKVLEYEDVKIMTFTEFIYFYLAKTTNSYLYGNLSLGYTEGFRQLAVNSGISLENITWSDFSQKEEKYEEVLIDIVFLIINKELKDKNKVLFGIDIGLGSKLFFIKDSVIYEKIKEIDTNFYYIYDKEYLKSFYGSLYMLKDTLGDEFIITKGDFTEFLEEKQDEIRVRTLFKVENKEYNINKKNLIKIF